MHSKEIVAIIIPTYNCLTKISTTIDSVLNQVFTKKKIRIIIIDNCSTDGTYEKVLEYSRINKDLVSIYRLSEATKPTVLLQKAMNLLKDVPIAYSAIIKAGDEVYPNFVSDSIYAFENAKDFKGKLLLCETNLIDEYGNIVEQKPIYTDNCILKGEIHYDQYITNHIDHKVQAFYKGFPISTDVKLHEILNIIDFNDWFSKIFNFVYRSLNAKECLYLKSKLANVLVRIDDNPIDNLMHKLYMLEQINYIIKCMPNVSVLDKFNEETRKKSYKCLSNLALEYTIQQIKKGQNQIAYKCLLFSQMVYLDVVKEQMYIDVKDALYNTTLVKGLLKYEKQEDSTLLEDKSLVFQDKSDEE